MEKLISSFMNEISNVMGVKAAYLVNHRGELLYPTAEKQARSFFNSAASLELVQAMGIFEMAGEDLNEMEMVFLEGKLLIYGKLKLNFPTRFGVQETVLVIVGEKTFNKAHLRLALNVSLANVLTDKKYKKLDQPVKIKKASTLTRDKMAEADFLLAEKARTLLT